MWGAEAVTTNPPQQSGFHAQNGADPVGLRATEQDGVCTRIKTMQPTPVTAKIQTRRGVITRPEALQGHYLPKECLLSLQILVTTYNLPIVEYLLGTIRWQLERNPDKPLTMPEKAVVPGWVEGDRA